MRFSRVRSAPITIAVAVAIAAGAANAQNEPQNQLQTPQSLANAYSGMIVCDQQRG